MTGQLLHAALVNLGYTVLGIVLVVLLWKAADRWLFPGIDFIPEVRGGNVAAAILAGALLLFCGQMVAAGLH